MPHFTYSTSQDGLAVRALVGLSRASVLAMRTLRQPVPAAVPLRNGHFEQLRPEYPEVEALLVLQGIGLYSALKLVGEFGDVRRFHKVKQAAAYTGLTTRVFQSGDNCLHGHFSRQGSGWLRWILLEAAMKFVRKDVPLANFDERIRKRSSAKIARVASARKLAQAGQHQDAVAGSSTLSRSSGKWRRARSWTCA